MGAIYGFIYSKISRGRTIREFIADDIIVPYINSNFMVYSFGGTGLYIELFGAGGLYDLVNSQVELALFSV